MPERVISINIHFVFARNARKLRNLRIELKNTCIFSKDANSAFSSSSLGEARFGVINLEKPIKPTKIIIVRHGESYGNLKRIMAGQTDVELTERGYLQARAAFHALSEEKIDAVYSSDLVRAVETARPHAEARGLPIILNEGLREINLGDYEGRPISEIEKKVDPSFVTYWGEGFGTYAFPGGETAIEAGERFYQALLKIAQMNEGKTLLVATHAAVIRAFFGKIRGIDAQRLGGEVPFPTNASYSVVELRGGGFVPLLFSVCDHLREIGFLDTTKDKSAK